MLFVSEHLALLRFLCLGSRLQAFWPGSALVAERQEFTDLLSPGPQCASTWVLLTLSFLLGCIWSSRGPSAPVVAVKEALFGRSPMGLRACQVRPGCLADPAPIPCPPALPTAGARVRKKGHMMLQWLKDMVGWVFGRSLGGSFSQDGGIGRYTLLPCTTKKGTTTNLKTKTTRTTRKSNCVEVQQPRS